MPKLIKQKIIVVKIVDNNAKPEIAGTEAPVLKTFYRLYLDEQVDAPDVVTLKKITLALKNLNLPATETSIKVLANFEINNTYNFVIQSNDHITVHSAQPIPISSDALNNLELKTSVVESMEPVIDTELIETALLNKVFAEQLDKADKTPKTKDTITLQLNVIAAPVPIDNNINDLYTRINNAASLLAQQTAVVTALKDMTNVVDTVIQKGKTISKSSASHWSSHNATHAKIVLAIDQKNAALGELQTKIQNLLSLAQKQYNESVAAHPELLTEPRVNLIRAMQLTALTYYRELRVKLPITPENITAFNDQFEKIARINATEQPELIFDANLLSANHSMLENIANGMLEKFNKRSSMNPLNWAFSRPRALFDSFFKALEVKFCRVVEKSFAWMWGSFDIAMSPDLVKTENDFNEVNKTVDSLVRAFQTLRNELSTLFEVVKKYEADCHAKVAELKRLRELIASNVQEANTIVNGMEANCQGIDALIEAVEDRLEALKEAAKNIDGHYATPGNLVVEARKTLATIKAESDDSLTQGRIHFVKASSNKIKEELDKLTASKTTLSEANKDLAEVNKLMTTIDTHLTAQNAAATQNDRLISAAMKLASLFENDSLAYWQDQVRWKGGVRMDTSFGSFTVPLSIFKLFNEKQKLRMPLQIAEARAFLETAKKIADDAEQRGSHRLGVFRVRSYEVSKLHLLIADIKLNQSQIGFVSKDDFDQRLDQIKPDWRSKYHPAMRAIKPVEVKLSPTGNSATIDPASLSLSGSAVSAVSTSPSSTNDKEANTRTTRSLSRSSIVV